MLGHSYYKELVRRPGKLQRNKQIKDQKIYVGRSTTLHNLLFCVHTLWQNYVTVTFLLVNSSGTNHDLLCLCRGKAQKSEQRHKTKNFSKLPNDLSLLTMVKTVACPTRLKLT